MQKSDAQKSAAPTFVTDELIRAADRARQPVNLRMDRKAGVRWMNI
jgi:hypothetical protein